MTDWFAVADTDASPRAGLDLEMPGPGTALRCRTSPTRSRRARSTRPTLDAQVRRPARRARPRRRARRRPGGARALRADRPPRTARSRARPRSTAIVLLRNDGRCSRSTPAACARVAVIGPNADRAQVMGGGSAELRAALLGHAARRRCASACQGVDGRARARGATSTAQPRPGLRGRRGGFEVEGSAARAWPSADSASCCCSSSRRSAPPPARLHRAGGAHPGRGPRPSHVHARPGRARAGDRRRRGRARRRRRPAAARRRRCSGPGQRGALGRGRRSTAGEPVEVVVECTGAGADATRTARVVGLRPPTPPTCSSGPQPPPRRPTSPWSSSARPTSGSPRATTGPRWTCPATRTSSSERGRRRQPATRSSSSTRARPSTMPWADECAARPRSAGSAARRWAGALADVLTGDGRPRRPAAHHPAPCGSSTTRRTATSRARTARSATARAC